MIEPDDLDFGNLVSEAIDNIPEPYSSHLENIAFLIEDEPDEGQRQKLHLYPGETLYGLYEGIPLPKRGGGTKILPDKITVFKKPLLSASFNLSDLRQKINHTVWHEVAHYFGLNHKRIHEIENKHKQE